MQEKMTKGAMDSQAAPKTLQEWELPNRPVHVSNTLNDTSVSKSQ